MVTKMKAKMIQLKRNSFYFNLKVIKTNSCELNSSTNLSFKFWKQLRPIAIRYMSSNNKKKDKHRQKQKNP